jgi:hypothetical protein
MAIKIIQEKLNSYQCQSKQETDHALREITQEIALMSLSRSGFFKHAAFHGGSCLRILSGINRFSEDLDFILKDINPKFKWEPFLNNISKEFSMYGYEISILDRSSASVDRSLRKVFIKDDSIGKILDLHVGDVNQRIKNIKINLEIDTNPPLGSKWQIKYLDFPLPYMITTQDNESAFALKNHALLCRQYIKGRDWYDFIWCISKQYRINFPLLSNAINQTGAWENQQIPVTKDWYLKQMRIKISKIDWEIAKDDILRFLKPSDIQVFDLWNEEFFNHYLDKLSLIL